MNWNRVLRTLGQSAIAGVIVVITTIVSQVERDGASELSGVDWWSVFDVALLSGFMMAATTAAAMLMNLPTSDVEE